MKIDPDELVTQTQAAEIRGVSVQAIGRLIKRGKLKTVTIGKRRSLLRSEVIKFAPSRAGRPKKKRVATKSKKRRRKPN
jgi:predicted site-specific integrase-resolvase